MEIAQAALVIGRPLTLPPRVDAEKVQILRKAFSSLFKNPEYLAECKQAVLKCSKPSSGEQMLTFVEKFTPRQSPQ